MSGKQNGFTLIELLIVLGVCSLLLFIAVPIQFSSLEKQETRQFLETFRSDVMLVQSMSYAATDPVDFTFDRKNHTYQIRTKYDDDFLIERSYPSDWQITDNFPFDGITFRNDGGIAQGGTITVTTPTEKYKIIFPLSKGRCYVKKQ